MKKTLAVSVIGSITAVLSSPVGQERGLLSRKAADNPA